MTPRTTSLDCGSMSASGNQGHFFSKSLAFSQSYSIFTIVLASLWLSWSQGPIVNGFLLYCTLAKRHRCFFVFILDELSTFCCFQGFLRPARRSQWHRGLCCSAGGETGLTLWPHIPQHLPQQTTANIWYIYYCTHTYMHTAMSMSHHWVYKYLQIR